MWVPGYSRLNLTSSFASCKPSHWSAQSTANFRNWLIEVPRIYGMEPEQITGWLKVVGIASRIFGPAFTQVQDRISKRKVATQLQSPATEEEVVDDFEDALEMVQTQLQRFEESSSSDVARRTFEYQQTQKLASGIATVKLASEMLGNDKVPDVEPDLELYSRIFGDVADVSADEKRIVYAKILAGEVKQPGSSSLKALSILRDMDQRTAELFNQLCSLAISMRFADGIHDARVVSLGGNAGNNALQKYGLSFDNLNVLNEYGLIIADYNSYHRIYRISIPDEARPVTIAFSHQNRSWVLKPSSGFDAQKEFRLTGVAMTKAGRELSQVVEIGPTSEYTVELRRFFDTQNLSLVEIPGPAN